MSDKLLNTIENTLDRANADAALHNSGLDIVPVNDAVKSQCTAKIFAARLMKNVIIIAGAVLVFAFSRRSAVGALDFATFGIFILGAALLIFCNRDFFALMSGNFDVYGGKCRGKNEFEKMSSSNEYQVQLNGVTLDVSLETKNAALKGQYMYLVVIKRHGKNVYYLCSAPDGTEETRSGEIYP